MMASLATPARSSSVRALDSEAIWSLQQALEQIAVDEFSKPFDL